MPLVTHPVRSSWGSQPRSARCVCEWLHRKWDGAAKTDHMFVTFWVTIFSIKRFELFFSKIVKLEQKESSDPK